MKKITSSEIVFTLRNSGIHHDYSALAFVTFEMLLQKPDSGIEQFIDMIDYFNKQDFEILNQCIQFTSDNEVKMDEKNLIIFYAVICFVCSAFWDIKNEKYLGDFMDDDFVDFPAIRNKLLEFGTVVSQKLRKEYSHLKHLAEVTEKISID